MNPVYAILKHYEQKGIYKLGEDTHNYILQFNRATLPQVLVPKFTEDIIRRNPRFLYKGKLYPIDKFFVLLFHSRMKSISKHKLIYNNLLLHDILNLFTLQINVPPVTHNNKTKLESRIRVVKDSYVRNGETIEFIAIGDALQSGQKLLNEDELEYYVNLINPDPIGADKPAQSVFSKLKEGQKYYAPLFSINKDKFTSIFPIKQNIVERFKAHITSDSLEFVEPEVDYINKSAPAEYINALFVFDEINDDLELIGGEIFISERLASKKVIMRRSININGLNYIIMPVGTKVKKGDIIAWNLTGEPVVTHQIDQEAEIEAIDYNYPTGYTIRLKYQAPIGVARLVSRTGLKGMTSPRSSLGFIQHEGKVFPVDAVAGPNSLKAGFNMIRLAWLSWKQKRKKEPIDLPLDEDKVNELTSDIEKVLWISPNGQKKMVYAGVIPILVTTKTNEHPIKKSKVMPETLKFLKMHGHERLVDLIIDEGIDEKERLIVEEMINIINGKTNELKSIDKNTFLKAILSIDLRPLASVKTHTKLPPILLLNPKNKGFIIKYDKSNLIMPSYHLIMHFINYFGEYLVYPDFYMYAIRTIMSIQKGSPKDKVLANYRRYLSALTNILLQKRGYITNITTPKLYGGSFHQLPCKYVPRNTIVVFDPQVENLLKEKGELYDISVRNPVLWNAQLSIKKVMPVIEFFKLLRDKYGIKSVGHIISPKYARGAVLRNPLDMMNDQSDADGDELSIAIPLNPTTQQYLKELYKKQFAISKFEKEWIADYMNGEKDNSKLKKEPFKLYDMDRKTFNEIMIKASHSKNSIGQGTLNLWKFTTLTEFLLSKNKISQKDVPVLLYMYGRIVQEFIVRGIKYNNGTEYDYTIFVPQNAKNYIKEIASYWRDTNIDEKYIKLFISILLNCDHRIIQAASRICNGGTPDLMVTFLKNLKNTIEFTDLLAFKLLNNKGGTQ